MLYDEIDAHVGGRAAVAVGTLLAMQGKESQVVVVTHTAQVAALADEHFVVEKVLIEGGRDGSGSGVGSMHGGGQRASVSGIDSLEEEVVTKGDGGGIDPVVEVTEDLRDGEMAALGAGVEVTIRKVKGSEREAEVARMAAGDIGGTVASELAREMLRHRGPSSWGEGENCGGE
ncbi:unnamed protein product [Choristocarpus tenellus]